MPEPAQCVSNAILCKNILLEKLSFFFSNGQSLLFRMCERVSDQSISKHVASIKYKKETSEQTTENPFSKQNIGKECLTSLLSSCEAHSYSRLTSTTASFSELSRFGPSGFSRQTWMSKWTCKNITVNHNLVPFNDRYTSCFSF